MVSRVIELSEEQHAVLADIAAKRKEFMATMEEVEDELNKLDRAENALLGQIASPLQSFEVIENYGRRAVSRDGKYLVVQTLPGVGEQS